MFTALQSLKANIARFGRARRGSAAIEFAFVIIPFFTLVVGTAEVSMIGLAQTNLDFAVTEIGRQIRTGQAQEAGLSAGQIKQDLCDEFARFLAVDCDANLYLDVQRYPSFAAIANNDPIVNGDLDESGFGYQPGGSSDIVVVRAYYRWHVLTPLFERIFANTDGGERIIVSTMMFRNEPF
jgi:Flp pilus assembly protein TadG